MAKDEYDIFVNYRLYPKAEAVFDTSSLSLEEIKDDCIFVLDTNALLIPYSTGSQSLTEISKVLVKLKEQERLVIPGQVAREFANNRPDKLKDLFQQLSRKQNGVQPVGLGKYPLLENVPEYNKVVELEKQLNEQLAVYRKAIGEVVDHVRSWVWNDPVSLMYNELFTSETILDIEIDQKKVSDDLSYRYIHKIPPGYKDGAKADAGIGDLLIWMTILELAANQKKHVMFVSGDEKNDWFHISEKQALYPRYELTSEFRSVSENKTFHIIRLSEALQLMGADEKAVEEVKIEESVTIPRYNAQITSAIIEDAIYQWLASRPFDAIDIFAPADNNIDFVVLESNKSKRAIIITALNPSWHFKSADRIHDKLFRSLQKINSGEFVVIELVFVAHNQNYDFDLIQRFVTSELSNSPYKTTTLFFIGYLDSNGVFELKASGGV